MITRIAECACCHRVQQEALPGGGWVGWFGLHGVVLNGDPDPMFCEECKPDIMNLIDQHVGEKNVD